MPNARADNKTESSRPPRETWVALIAGYCLFGGGVEVAWQIGLIIFKTDGSAISEFKYYFGNEAFKFNWSVPWAAATPICEIWNHYVVIAVHLFFGLLLWTNRGNSRRLAGVALLTSFLGAVFTFLLHIGQRLEGLVPFSSAQSIVTEGGVLLALAAIPLVLWRLLYRDMENEDRWRALLAAWLVLTGIMMACCAPMDFYLLHFDNPLTHIGWRTLSWDTLWPLTAVLTLATGIIGIICGLRLKRNSTRLITTAWLVAVSSTLSEAGERFLGFVIGNHSSYPGPFGSSSPIQFNGFQSVGWSDWAEVLHSILKSLAIFVPLIIFAHHQARRLASESLPCRQCGYNLTGNTSGRCPECGLPVTPATTA